MESKNETGTSARKFETFSKANVGDLRVEIDAALKAVREKIGLSLKLGNCSFSTNFAKFSLEVSALRTDGNAIDAIARSFQQWAGVPVAYVHRDSVSIGVRFAASDLFREFPFCGGRYKVVGLVPRSKKHPVVLEDLASGKRYKYGADAVARALDAEDGIAPEASKRIPKA